MKDISLRILDMECAACVARLDRALEKLPGVQRAAVNYTAASALITYDERVTDLAAISPRPARSRAAPSRPASCAAATRIRSWKSAWICSRRS